MIRKTLKKSIAVCIVSFMFYFVYSQSTIMPENVKVPKSVCWWTFDSGSSGLISENGSDTNDTIIGNFRLAQGVNGLALKSDGYTTNIARKSNQAPRLGSSFTVEARIAAATYPWNRVPILAHVEMGKSGFYLGIGPQGQIGISASINGVRQYCETREMIALHEWMHMAATFDPTVGFQIYVNGKITSRLDVKGNPVYASGSIMLTGMNSGKIPPSNPVRIYTTLLSWFSFDGIYDEIKVYNEALFLNTIQQLSQKSDKLLPEAETDKVNLANIIT